VRGSDALFPNDFREDLFDTGEAVQEIKVGSESAPSFSQTSEWRKLNETPVQSQESQKPYGPTFATLMPNVGRRTTLATVI